MNGSNIEGNVVTNHYGKRFEITQRGTGDKVAIYDIVFNNYGTPESFQTVNDEMHPVWKFARDYKVKDLDPDLVDPAVEVEERQKAIDAKNTQLNKNTTIEK